MHEKKQKEDKPKYSLWSNLIYIYKVFFRDHGKIMYLVFLLRLILDTLSEALVAAIPAIVVSLIERQRGISEFVAVICGFVLLYGLLLFLKISTNNRYEMAGTISRCFSFNSNLVYKALATDYINRESNENQKLFGKAMDAGNGDWVGIERMYREIPNVSNNALGMLLYGGAILLVDVRILFVLLLMLVFNIKTNQFARNYMNRTREEDTEIRRKFNYLYQKSVDLTSGKDARIYRLENWFEEMFKSYVEKGAAWQKRVEKHFYLPVASDTIFIALRDGLAYVILIHMVLNGEIQVAVFVLMLSAVSGFSVWMFGLVTAWNNLLDANKPVCDFRAVMEMEDSFRHEGGIMADTSGFPPEIILNDVSFRYPGEEKEILSHISLRIGEGEKIALVGGNGAGKTTLVKLLCGFYHPTEGEILVNGISIEDYNIESYFKMLGIVFQDSENLAYNLIQIVSGCSEDEADSERFWKAVKAAGLYEKIQSLEKKEYTYLTTVFDDHGVNKLSGGEMQKLMLARCIYKDAPFMILDEPTAALDPIAESQMYEEYNHIAENKTSIFISHRLASTRFCDRILFLEDGRIAEQGTHEELLRSGGRYAGIYEIQSHYYREGEKKNLTDMEAAYEI